MSRDAAIDVTLYTNDYLPVGKAPGYASCSVTWRNLAPGPGQIVVSETDPIAQTLLGVGYAPVPATAVINGRRWSGRVSGTTLDREGPPGSGTITADLVDDWVWLQAMLASPNGANPVLTGMPQYDTRTGPAATVAAYYINAAAARLGVPVLALPPTGDGSQTITLNARWQTLADLLTDPLRAVNVTMPARLWLPGDDPIPGYRLTAPTVVFYPVAVAAKPWLRWGDYIGGISKVTLTTSAPTAYREILGLAGDEVDRGFDSYIDTGLQSQLGNYGLPEVYADATDVNVAGPESQSKGQQDLLAKQGTASASLEVQDGAPWSFPADYDLGDLATLTVAGVALQEQVSSVTATDDRSSGLVITPQLGDGSASATSDELIVNAIASIAMQLRLIQTGR